MFLIILLSILSGIVLAALYAFLVMRFTSSYDREISIIFFPIPFILGASICYSFAYNQKISGALAVICTLVFFKFIMGTLGVTFSKVYERLTLPKVYKNYHYTSDYKTHDLEGEKHLVRLPEDIHHFAKGIYLNPQNELVIYDKSIPMDRGELSIINYIEKYNALGERMQESDTLEVKQDMPSIFDGNSQHFTKKETLERKNIEPLYVESYKTKGNKYETILYFCYKFFTDESTHHWRDRRYRKRFSNTTFSRRHLQRGALLRAQTLSPLPSQATRSRGQFRYP